MTNHTSIDAEFIGTCFKLYSNMIRPSYRTGLAENRTLVEKYSKKRRFLAVFVQIEGGSNKFET